MSRASRADRHESLVAALRARGSAAMAELAAELGVSVRTLRRDVAALRERGLDIEGERGRGGGIRFARHAPLPALRLQEDEAVGLWLSVEIARRTPGLPFSAAGRGGVRKVLASLPDTRRQQLRRLCDRIVVGPGASAHVRASAGPIAATVLDTFERCFRDEVCLGFRYTDRVGAVTRRRVEPHGLYVELPVWYVLAVDRDKDALRMFRMDRIASPRPLTEPFTPTPGVLEEMLGRNTLASLR